MEEPFDKNRYQADPEYDNAVNEPFRNWQCRLSYLTSNICVQLITLIING